MNIIIHMFITIAITPTITITTIIIVSITSLMIMMILLPRRVCAARSVCICLLKKLAMRMGRVHGPGGLRRWPTSLRNGADMLGTRTACENPAPADVTDKSLPGGAVPAHLERRVCRDTRFASLRVLAGPGVNEPISPCNGTSHDRCGRPCTHMPERLHWKSMQRKRRPRMFSPPRRTVLATKRRCANVCNKAAPERKLLWTLQASMIAHSAASLSSDGRNMERPRADRHIT